MKAVAQDQYMFTCGLSRLEGPGRAGNEVAAEQHMDRQS